MAEPRTPTVGMFLRDHRCAKAMSIAEVARTTRIPHDTINRIEADHFDDLPGEVFTRGFLKAYATAVGLAPDDVLARYTAARRIVSVEPLPSATPVVRTGSRSRHFGVAIAFVLLLVLFTLALSIVLRPRGRDRMHELSSLSSATAFGDAISMVNNAHGAVTCTQTTAS